MRVLYDYQAFTMQHIGGVSKGICSILSHMPPQVDMRFGVEQCNNVYLRESGLIQNLPPARIDWVTTKRRLYFPGLGTIYRTGSRWGLIRSAEFFNRRLSIKLLKEGDYDVFHPTFFDDYFLRYLKDRPFVLTIHDMMPELFPDYFKKNDQQVVAKRKMVSLAAAIAVPSNNTKEDVVRLLGVAPERITVIHRGSPEVEVVKEDAIVDSPYFLFVGARDVYKNFMGLLNDYQLFHQRVSDVILICVGAPFSEAERKIIQDKGLSNVVVRVSADDKQLKNLYAHAQAFIFPSRYEGFGLPVLEAMAYGCPLLLNNRSCFPEVAGDAALYFNSDGGASELPGLLQEVMGWDSEKRKDVIKKGYNRLELFSWKKAAEQYAELYQSLL